MIDSLIDFLIKVSLFFKGYYKFRSKFIKILLSLDNTVKIYTFSSDRDEHIYVFVNNCSTEAVFEYSKIYCELRQKFPQFSFDFMVYGLDECDYHKNLKMKVFTKTK